MKIFYMSDLHLEFGPLSLVDFEGTKDDIVILSGDIGVAASIRSLHSFLAELKERVRLVLYIPGNHEFYGQNMSKSLEDLYTMQHQLGNNVIFGEKIYRVINDIAFIGATMWTDFKNRDWYAMQHCSRNMSDFDVIRHGKDNRRFLPEDSINIFEDHYKFIEHSVRIARADNLKTVVFTHHGVSEIASLPQFKGSILQGAFFASMEDEILTWQPNVWIHGHIHNTVDFSIDQTRILTNPRGYYGHSLNHQFDINGCLEL